MYDHLRLLYFVVYLNFQTTHQIGSWDVQMFLEMNLNFLRLLKLVTALYRS